MSAQQSDRQKGKHKDTYLSPSGSLGATWAMLSWRALIRNTKIKHFPHHIRQVLSLLLSLSPLFVQSAPFSVSERCFLYISDMVVTGYYGRADFLSVCCVCVLMRTISLLRSLVTLHEFATPKAYLLLLRRAEHEPLIKLTKTVASTPHVVSTERY